jgi:hypothetical protein
MRPAGDDTHLDAYWTRRSPIGDDNNADHNAACYDCAATILALKDRPQG